MKLKAKCVRLNWIKITKKWSELSIRSKETTKEKIWIPVVSEIFTVIFTVCFLWIVERRSIFLAICFIHTDILYGCIMSMWNFETFTTTWKTPFEFNIWWIGIYTTWYWYRLIQRCTQYCNWWLNAHRWIYKMVRKKNEDISNNDLITHHYGEI